MLDRAVFSSKIFIATAVLSLLFTSGCLPEEKARITPVQGQKPSPSKPRPKPDVPGPTPTPRFKPAPTPTPTSEEGTEVEGEEREESGETDTTLERSERTELLEKTISQDAPAAGSREHFNALRQVVAVLNASHKILTEATSLHFGIEASSLGNSLFKELGMYLGRHFGGSQDQPAVVRVIDTCVSGAKRSMLQFAPARGDLGMALTLATCGNSHGVRAANITYNKANRYFDIEFFNDNLSSTSTAWVQLISSKGKCRFYFNPGLYGEDSVVRIDCGESRGSCGSDDGNMQRRYEGVAMQLPSGRAGVTEVAMFERLLQQHSVSGSRVEVSNFYACAHRFEQGRTDCSEGICLDKKKTVVGRLENGRRVVTRDYRAAEREAYERSQQRDRDEANRVAQEALAAQKAQQAQALAAEGAPVEGGSISTDGINTQTPEQAEKLRQHQEAMRLQQQGPRQLTEEELSRMTPEEQENHERLVREHTERMERSQQNGEQPAKYPTTARGAESVPSEASSEISSEVQHEVSSEETHR